MARHTGLTQYSAEDGFRTAMACDEAHMSAFSSLGMRSAFHHRGFETPKGHWLEVWWTTDQRTGHVTDFFIDTRGLNLK